MRRIGFTLAVLLVASLGWTTRGQDQAAPAQDRADAEKKQQLWKLVERVLAGHQFLSFRVEVSDAHYKAVVQTEMAEEKLKTVIWFDGQWTAAIVIEDGRVQEYRSEWLPFPDDPNFRLSNVCLSYDAYVPGGTKTAVLLDNRRGCLTGTYLHSWVGKKSRFLDEVLRNRIEEGKLLPDVRVGDHDCRVLLWRQPGPAPRQDKFFFGAATGLLLRWETITENDQHESLTKVREYSQHKLGDIPRDQKWEFSLPAERPQPTSQPTSRPAIKTQDPSGEKAR